MKNLQEIFDRLQELKKEKKEISKEYKDVLLNTPDYEELTEKLKEMREKKKQIEMKAQAHLGKRWDKLEETKNEIETLNEMLTDMAMTQLMKGESIGVKDQYENNYEPVYKISFKKVH